MVGATKIAWTNETWNPVTGCTKASEGCAHCYAADIAQRFWGDRKFSDVRFHKDRLGDPLHWRKPRMVFVNSMGDLFHDDVSDAEIAAVFGVMAASPLHAFQVLTKRPQAMCNWFAKMNSFGGIGKYIRSDDGRPALRGLFDAVKKTEMFDGREYRSATDPWMEVMNAAACNYGQAPIPNVWLGVTAENQDYLWRIGHLLQIPATVRFVSLEPLLGPVNLFSQPWTITQGNIHWIIVGCESGPKRRPCDTQWIADIFEQCEAADVPRFIKQISIDGEVVHDADRIALELSHYVGRTIHVEDIRQYPRTDFSKLVVAF